MRLLVAVLETVVLRNRGGIQTKFPFRNATDVAIATLRSHRDRDDVNDLR